MKSRKLSSETMAARRYCNIFNIPSEFRGAYKGEQKAHEAFKNMFAEKIFCNSFRWFG